MNEAIRPSALRSFPSALPSGRNKRFSGSWDGKVSKCKTGSMVCFQQADEEFALERVASAMLLDVFQHLDTFLTEA